MKSLVKILSLVAFFVISTATAFAADTVMMYGKTTPVLISGVNNAGTIWFQNDGATVYLPAAVDQQAHLTPDPAVPGGYKIEGWAWSDNLGWVSFSCRGGKNPQITGAECGAFDYSVRIDAAGVFHGYAWNDAMGYISMNSENHVPPALDGFGKPIVYGLKMTTTGAISGYAWSQSLGWLNFGGVYGRIKIEVSPITNTPENCPSKNAVGLCGCFGSNDPLGGDPSKLNPALDAGVDGAVKVADGYDKYVLSLYFKDENGAEITAGQFGKDKPYEAKVFFNWEDRVRRDQTNASTVDYNGDKVSKPFQNSVGIGGAILQKPVFLFTTESAKAAEDLFGTLSNNEAGTLDNSKEALAAMTFNISSVAPTYKANVSKIENTTAGTVKNDDLSLVPGFSDATKFKEAPNYLKLISIDWAIKNNTTGVTINGTSSFDDKHGTLEFKPALEVSKMTNSLSANTLWMFRNVPVGVEVEVKNNKTLPGGAVKYPDPSAISEVFVSGGKEFDIVFTKSSLDSLKGSKNIWQDSVYNKIIAPLSVSVDNSPNKFNASLEATLSEAVLSNLDTTPLPGNFAEGAGLYSKIFYNAEVFYGVDLVKNPITYFSNHLPRVVSTAVSNPSVVIQGTTYSQGQQVFSPQQGVSITGIGDQNVNIVRDLVFENIQKLLMNQDLPAPQGTVKIPSLNPVCGAGCLKIDLTNETIYYYDASDLVIEAGVPETDLYVEKNTVFVVNGGNLHINSNIYPTEQTSNKVGFVVFGDDKLYHGHVSIGPNVTNVRALIIADGTLFSAENDYISSGNDYGEPPSISPSDFNRQLLIEGGISTRNCIGCVDKAGKYYSIPRDPLLEKTDENKEIAKKYDLNYLRYFSLQLEYDDVTGNPIDQKCGEALTAEEILSPPDGCDGIDPTQIYDATKEKSGDLVPDSTLKAKGAGDDKTNPVYIKYVPPSPDSFVFSKEKSLTF